MANPTGIDPKESGEVFDGTVANPWSTHDVTVPLALLPVRVEARWFATASPSTLELRIRIYPDALHVANGPADPSGEVAPPVARGLPSRFALVLCRGGDVVGSRWGALVPEQPAVLDLDGFAAAESLGLAMRLDVGRTVATQLTHVAVFGLRGGNVEDDATTLSKVLRDHTADRGLRVLAPGTSTNAAGSTVAAATGTIPANSDGGRLASALGVAAPVFEQMPGAHHDADVVPKAMAHAMWPASWGYWLETILGPAITDAMRDAGRAFYLAHVRADGPLPTLAVGRQPYGVLPTTAFRRWRRDDGSPDPFVDALRALLPRWVQAGQFAPRLPATGDALPNLLTVLARQEHAVRYGLRSAMAYDVATAVWYGEGVDDDRRAQLQAMLATPIIEQLAAVGVAVTDPFLVTPLVHGEHAREVMLPLVGAHAPTYLAALAALDDPWITRGNQGTGASPRTLLYVLLRQATLLVLGRTADRLNGLPVIDWREADVRTPSDPSVWQRMEMPIAAYGGLTARQLFETDPPGAPFDALRDHRSALSTLAAATVDDLERATRGAIDTASHRLDAWITAHATQRLRLMRDAQPTGIALGAYAWLEAPPVPATGVVEGSSVDRGSRGFMLAPSLDHARTAAVLRAAFEARPTSDLAVDLSSRRVARSRGLLDGLRAGRSMAELLGYEIERTIGDAALVSAVRAQFPLQVADADPNRARLDGLAAYLAWRATPPGGTLAAAASAVAELVDGVADLLLAESVYQQVRGQPERAGAVLEAVAAGTVAPPECAVVQTVAAGERREYQVVWALPAGAGGWPGDDDRVRAIANRPMNDALATLLPARETLAASVTFDDGTGTQTVDHDVTTLELCALDLCALVHDEFAGSALEAAFAALAPAGLKAAVAPSEALLEALVVTRGFRDALQRSTPWTSGEAPTEPDPGWAATAAAAMARLAQLSGDDDGPALLQLEAFLGAATGDVQELRSLVEARVAKLAAITDTAERVRSLSGLPASRSLDTALASATELASSTARITWLADLARIRPPLAGLELVTSMVDVSTDAGVSPAGAIVVTIGARANVSRAMRLDAWTEARPQTHTAAAVAMHHDAPRARAAHAVLVAVPPEPGLPWSPEVLLDTLRDTFDLVAARVARPYEVWGPTLPALYLSASVDDSTISTTMSELAVDVVMRD